MEPKDLAYIRGLDLRMMANDGLLRRVNMLPNKQARVTYCTDKRLVIQFT
jgi:hypothetical protein